MLFPAVHELGFKAGHTFYRLCYHTDTTSLPTLREVLQFLAAFPNQYRQWWLNLVVKDPMHVFVETTLLVTIVFILLARNTEGYKNNMKERLTKAEEEELLWEWKHQLRAPLAPPQQETQSIEDRGGLDDFQVVVQKQDGKWLTVTTNNPNLVPKDNSKGRRRDGNSQEAKEFKVINFCNFDFLGMQMSTKIRQASTDAMSKYGCGSCGPRGFYGTIDTHLQLEDSISKFTNTDGAIMYSDGASTCSSTVAAFAKRGDVLVVDEGVYEPLSTGVYLSRANVHWFRHNDVDDLERVLKELQANDKKLGRKPNAQRRFIVVEGLYKNLGTIAPLDKIVELKHKYHYRLILDESFSFGTLGETGRGALEAYGKRPMHDAEIITIALENSLGSIGGVTVGNEEVVDHQRLSGAGYCFSASAPPFTASAAMASLSLMESEPELVRTLQANVRYMYEQLENTPIKRMVVTSDPRSPIVVLQLERESEYEAAIMSGIMQECLQRGVAIVATGQDSSSHMRTVLAPCIRLTVSTLHTKEDIDKVIQTLVEAADLITSNYPLDATK
ncbi:8-amino-7-oxononanoate synthase [Nitzschia inconspicua]|uniref:8-amino-7-oxononanoate synthase n=1 Tax=Nitzschia inconspicua TaxID=303405 RepID=A0A9K3M6B3_9STRA|nr:8-amino-7-oxononanoate synthase [Nitzschia inconspicua]